MPASHDDRLEPSNSAELSRRQFLGTATRAAASVVVAASSLSALPVYAVPRKGSASGVCGGNRARDLVKSLYHGLSEQQKNLVCLPYDHRRRRLLGNNWWVVKPKIGEVYTPDQQALMKEILRLVSSEEGYGKFLNVMETDGGGYPSYHAAVFGDPDAGKFEWVLTGRHLTIRADAHSEQNAAFGGPILYGHAPVTFTEAPDHPKNAFWYQGLRANHVFSMLDGKQRSVALIERAPVEEQIFMHGKTGSFPGLRVGAMSRDQKAEVEKVISDLLLPFAKPDADMVRDCLKRGGGVDTVRMAFYKEDDLGNDQIWDLWRLEGPNFVWYFRGAPHVHTWVNVAKDAPGPLINAKLGNLDANEF